MNKFMRRMFGGPEDGDRRIVSLIVGLALGMLTGLLLIGLGIVDAQGDSICVDPGDGALVFEGRQAVWDAMDAGLLMRPKDLKLRAIEWIYANDTKTAGYYVMDSRPANQRWVFVYPVLDPPGRRQMPHDFCMVWIYDTTAR